MKEDETEQALAKHWNALMVFGAALVLTHLLSIDPREFSAAGIKVDLGSVVVVRGILSVLFLNAFLTGLKWTVSNEPVIRRRRRLLRFGMMRGTLAGNRKLRKAVGRSATPALVKESARTTTAIYETLFGFHRFVKTGFGFIILVVALFDLVPFATYIYERTSSIA